MEYAEEPPPPPTPPPKKKQKKTKKRLMIKSHVRRSTVHWIYKLKVTEFNEWKFSDKNSDIFHTEFKIQEHFPKVFQIR